MEEIQKLKNDYIINFNDSEYKKIIFKSLLFLVLAISGNFVGSTLSCQLQNQMTNNPYVKHLTLLFIIYFTITTLDPNSSTKSPVYSLKNTLIIWLFYIMFTKQDLDYSMIAIALLIISHVSDQFVEYYEKINADTGLYTSIRNTSFSAGVIFITIGFLTYLINKRYEYGEKFDFIKFIFGNAVCDSLK